MNRKIKICIFSFIAFVMTIVGYGGTSKALADDSESEVSAVYDIKNGDPIAVSKNQWDEYQEVQDWEDEPDVPSTYLKKLLTFPKDVHVWVAGLIPQQNKDMHFIR